MTPMYNWRKKSTAVVCWTGVVYVHDGCPITQEKRSRVDPQCQRGEDVEGQYSGDHVALEYIAVHSSTVSAWYISAVHSSTVYTLKKKESTKVPFDYRVEGQYFHADLPWTQNCVTSDVETELGLRYSLLLVPAYDNTE